MNYFLFVCVATYELLAHMYSSAYTIVHIKSIFLLNFDIDIFFIAALSCKFLFDFACCEL